MNHLANKLFTLHMKLHSPEVEYENEIYSVTYIHGLNLPIKNESHRSSASKLDQHNTRKTPNVHFNESMYNAEEESTYESQITAASSKDIYKLSILDMKSARKRIFHCSNFHFYDTASLPEFLGFGTDVSAPRSVVGKTTLDKILLKLIRIPCLSHDQQTYFVWRHGRLLAWSS